MEAAACRGDGDRSAGGHDPLEDPSAVVVVRMASCGEAVAVGAGGDCGAGAGGTCRHPGPLHGAGGRGSAAFGFGPTGPAGSTWT